MKYFISHNDNERSSSSNTLCDTECVGQKKDEVHVEEEEENSHRRRNQGQCDTENEPHGSFLAARAATQRGALFPLYEGEHFLLF